MSRAPARGTVQFRANATTTTFELTVTERQAVGCDDTRLDDCTAT